MARIYMERLIKTVIELSHGNDWDTAVVEWEIIDCEEDILLVNLASVARNIYSICSLSKIS